MTKYEIKFGDNAVISGDFIVANTIQNSFNRVQELEGNDDLKDNLKRLCETVAAMTEELSKETAQQVAGDLDSLIKEATLAKPRAEWVQIAANAITGVAKTVKEVGKPVMDILKVILPMVV